MADTLITPEALADAARIEKSEETLGTLEKIIQRLGITEEEVASLSREDLNTVLENVLTTEYTNNYQYMFRAPNYTSDFSRLKVDDIQRVAVFTRIETIRETAFVDFVSDTVYFDSANFFLDNIQEAKTIQALDKQTRTELIKLLSDFSWRDAALDKNLLDRMDYADYGIAIETKDGVLHCAFQESGADPNWDAIHEIIVQCIGKDAYYGVDDDTTAHIRAILELDE